MTGGYYGRVFDYENDEWPYSYNSDLEVLKARHFSWWAKMRASRALIFSQARWSNSEAPQSVDAKFLSSKASYESKLYYSQQRVVYSNDVYEVKKWIFRNAEKRFFLAYINYNKPLDAEHLEDIRANPNYGFESYFKVVSLCYSWMLKHEHGIDFIFGNNKNYAEHPKLKALFKKADFLERMDDDTLGYFLKKYTSVDMEGLDVLPATWLRTLANQFFGIEPLGVRKESTI